MIKFNDVLPKDHEKKEKYDLAEAVFDAVFKHYNERVEYIKADVAKYEKNNVHIMNPEKFAYFIGMVSVLNHFLPEKDVRQDVAKPELWLEELHNKLGDKGALNG